jgi:hypothetical protein
MICTKKTLRLAISSAAMVVLVASQAAATCDTGEQPFPAVGFQDFLPLACDGDSALVGASNNTGAKAVHALLEEGTRSARSNGINSSGGGISGCFAQDDEADDEGVTDNSGCSTAVEWIGTLFT